MFLLNTVLSVRNDLFIHYLKSEILWEWEPVYTQSDFLLNDWHMSSQHRNFSIAYYRWHCSDRKNAPARIPKTIVLPNELESRDIRVPIRCSFRLEHNPPFLPCVCPSKNRYGMYPKNDRSNKRVSQSRHPCINLCFLDWSIIRHFCLAFIQKCFRTFPNFQKKAFHHQNQAWVSLFLVRTHYWSWCHQRPVIFWP